MPRQNRVDPYGRLIATPERGAWTGNRGVLLDREARLEREWRLKRWLICRLEFQGRHRQVWTPGRWTELFFLDEATALAAGHRPCAECRREDNHAFRAAWRAAHGPVRTLVELDEVLHAARGRRFRSALATLPAGAMFVHEERPYLWADGRAYPWSFSGYGAPVVIAGCEVDVLTPEPTVGVLRAGYACQMAARLTSGS